MISSNTLCISKANYFSKVSSVSQDSLSGKSTVPYCAFLASVHCKEGLLPRFRKHLPDFTMVSSVNTEFFNEFLTIENLEFNCDKREKPKRISLQCPKIFVKVPLSFQNFCEISQQCPIL